MAERALVKNAADPRQQRFAERKERDREALFLDALREAMQSPATRLVMWELLSRAGLFASIYRQSVEIHYLCGRRDFGLELQADIIRAEEDLYLKMETEGRARKRRDDREVDAAHLAIAKEQGAQNNG